MVGCVRVVSLVFHYDLTTVSPSSSVALFLSRVFEVFVLYYDPGKVNPRLLGRLPSVFPVVALSRLIFLIDTH